MNPTGRFSNRVEYYVRYRPGYPAAALNVLHEVLRPDTVVADIGSGTGISSRWLLQRVARVYGVEPNREMRERAVAHEGFISVDGTAEATGLPDASVDVVVCATAFHWFRVEDTRAEFRRILQPGGHVVLMWNIRDIGASPLQTGYEQAIADFAVDYRPDFDHNSEAAVQQFFAGVPYQKESVPNDQILDWDGFLGRALSASYMPLPGATRYDEMHARLCEVFDANAVDGRVRFTYRTILYWGLLPEA